MKSLKMIVLIGVTAFAGLGSANAQERPEPLSAHEWFAGIKLGLSDMWGDIGTKGVMTHYFNGVYFQSTHYMGGLTAGFSILPSVIARLELNAGSIYATDQYNIKEANRLGTSSTAYALYMRNLDMKSTILEGQLHLELLPLRLFEDSRIARWPLQPYVMAGLGVFHFNPKTTYTDPSGHQSWVETQPLHVENEGTSIPGAPAGYKTTQICYPIGAGLRYTLNTHWSLSMEYLLRLTNTDYLDGVSNLYVNPNSYSSYLSETNAQIAAQVRDKSYLIDPSVKHQAGEVRGNPRNKDAYSSLGFELIWRLPNKRDRY